MTGAPPASPGAGENTGEQAGAAPGTQQADGARTSPAPRGRPREASGGRQPQLWKAVFFTLAAIAIVAGVAWALLGSRFLIVRSVKVTGTGRLVSRAQVLAAAEIPTGLPLIRVGTHAVARRVGAIPQVLSAKVSRDWPDTVVIAIRLRTPVFAVPGSGGYELVDPYGVAVRASARRPAGLPLLTVPTPGQGASLRGSPSVHAAAVVLRELPRQIGEQVRKVSAATPSGVTVRLSDGVVIVWGSTARPAEKAKELAVLMRTHARYYDVSGPGTAVTRG